MIKFFRKIRQNMIKDNKVTKYVLYAIGEILLVVVGILIALNINNNNNKQQQETKVITLLETILSDLEKDIENADAVLEFEALQDSLLRQVLKGNVTKESYEDSRYIGLFLSFSNFEVSDNSYVNLVQSVNEIPEEYQEAYNKLSILHSEDKPFLKRLSKETEDFIYEKEQKWSSSFTWYSQFISMSLEGNYEPIPEMVDYVLNNPFHKNDVASLLIVLNGHQSSIMQYKHGAIQSYYTIHNVLEKTNELPEFITSHMIYLPSDAFLKYEGTYIMKDYDAIKIEISYDDGGLNWTQFGGSAGDEGGTTKIFAKSEVEFFQVSALPLKVFFEENDNGEIIGHKAILGDQEYYFVKSDIPKDQ
jgi:hypothetical protein